MKTRSHPIAAAVWSALVAVAGCDGPVAPATELLQPTGTIHVVVSMTGGRPPYAYRIEVADDSRSIQMKTEGDATWADVSAGSHAVWIRELAANCEVDGGNPVEVTVSGGGTAQAVFSLFCGPYTAWDRVTSPGPAADRFCFFENGFFEHGCNAASERGTYTRTDSIMILRFAGSGIATGSIHGDSLFIAYDVTMLLSDFENGWYLRLSSGN